MASTAAQDEFNALFPSLAVNSSRHPEDANSSDRSDVESGSEDPQPTAAKHYEKNSSGSDGEGRDRNGKMKSTYFIPKTRSEANTGPKGVIADAQAFEQAKKAHRFSAFASRKTSSPPQASPAPANQRHAYRNEDYERSSEEEDEDGFMARWRQRRLQELSDKKFGRSGSPGSRRTWGTLTKVDAEGYLDAIEQVSDRTVVVVFIYDHAVSYPATPLFPNTFNRRSKY